MIKKIVRKFLSRKIINNYYHLPKAVLANILYGYPARGLRVIGVTGTDGKTTTVNMIYQILKDDGKKVSMISTLNSPGLHVTSPDPFTLQNLIKKFRQEGSEYLVLEVTSHALDQYRVWGIKFDIGVITNITHEHLDYHQTFKNYSDAKLQLIDNTDFAIVNRQLIRAAGLQKRAGKIITFGIDSGDFNQKDIKLKLKLAGDYNLENALAALACAFVLGIDRNKAQQTLESFQNLTGRMEEVKNNRGFKIVIDFAHTPNGLKQALTTLRSGVKSARLIAVFGSAGKRDVQKRSLLGKVAARLADLLVVTAEDPRGELEIINQNIVWAAQKSGRILGKDLFVINNRQEAIDFAVNKLARKGDIIGIFGKGHERSINLDGLKELPWSDEEAVKKSLQDQS